MYIIQWNGCTITVNINSFNHVLSACDFPSPNLSIEYVIVINGEITIKNPKTIVRFTYINTNASVAITNEPYIIVSGQPASGTSDGPTNSVITFHCEFLNGSNCSNASTKVLFTKNVNIIIYCNTNTSTKLTAQSLSIFLYLASSDATVEIAIRMPMYSRIPSNTAIDRFLIT